MLAWIGIFAAGTVAVSAGVALQFSSYRASVLAIWLSWVAIFLAPWSLPAIRRNRRLSIFAALCLLLCWFSGYDCPYHWDAVQTVIRAQAFWDTGSLERISPFYVLLAPVVAAFPDTTIAAHLFAMLLGLASLLCVGSVAGQFAGKNWGMWAACMASMVPMIYLLYRWVVLDTFFLLSWTATLAALFAWSRRLNFWKLVLILLLTLLTVASKEMGALILFPVALGLVLLAPRRQRRKRLGIVAVLVLIAIPIGGFSIVRWADLQNTQSFFRGILHSDRGLTFVPFNTDLPEPWPIYFLKLLKQYAAYWAQMGFVVPAALALWRPRIHLGGWILAGAGALTQILWILISRADNWPDIYTFPLFHFALPKVAFLPFLFFALVILWLWVIRAICLRVDRKTWVILGAVLPGSLVLLSFMKASYDGEGLLTAWIAWNYPIVIISGGIYLAVRGLRLASRYQMPALLRAFCLMAVMMTLMSHLMHGTGIAARLRVVDLAHQRAYDWMRSQPERIVYTHWPFIYESPGYRYSNYNNGALAWRRDGWDVRSIRPFSNPDFQGDPGSFILFDFFHSYLFYWQRLDTTGSPAHEEYVRYWRQSLFRLKPKVTRQRAVVVRRLP